MAMTTGPGGGMTGKNLWATPLLSLTLFIFGPAQVYFLNSREFQYGVGDLIPYLAGLALAGAALVILIEVLAPAALAEKIQALLLAFALLLWLQGNFLAWDYGVLDGRDILWNEKTIHGVIDTSLWVLGLALAWRFSQPLKRWTRPLALALFVIQALTIGKLALTEAKHSRPFRYGIDRSNEFAFSGERNVIILILDTFQTDIFQEMLNESTTYAKLFSGFTYFRNALGGSPNTCTAIPFILTGRQYDNSQPLADFLKAAYLRSSIPLLLKRSGYRCDLFAWNFTGIYLDRSLASNLTVRIPIRPQDAAFLLDLSLFRQAPHFLKRLVYNDQHWLLTRLYAEPAPRRPPRAKKDLPKSRALKNWHFIQAMKATARVDASQPTFKYYHLSGLHPPLFKDADREIEKMAYTRANYARGAVDLVGLMTKFLAELKRIGAFDNSLVFIIGDHGPGSRGLQAIHLQALGNSHAHEIQDEALKVIKAGALPLILVKPFGMPGTRPLAVSDSPASLGDIPATVAVACGLANEFPGRPLFQLGEKEERSRRYLFYRGARETHDGYLGAMSEYWVRGFSWFDDSWHDGRRTFMPRGSSSQEGADR
jgi:hypothetical protein